CATPGETSTSRTAATSGRAFALAPWNVDAPMNDARERFTLVAMDAGARLQAFARDVRAGLTSRPKHLHCCYFYDGEGSLLFEEICELPEYYLPRAERAIFLEHADEIVSALPGDGMLIELGSGNAAKTRLLMDAVLRRQSAL